MTLLLPRIFFSFIVWKRDFGFFQFCLEASFEGKEAKHAMQKNYLLRGMVVMEN